MIVDPISLARKRLPAELQLIAECCDVCDAANKQDTISKTAQRIDDWWSFAKQVQRHQLLGSVAPYLLDIDVLPEGLQAKWRSGLQKRSGFSLRQASETVRLHQLLLANDVDNLVIKGVALGYRLYGSLTQKHSGDIDLLVRLDSAFDALTILQDEGFLPFATGVRMSDRQFSTVARHYKEVALINDRNEMIDLHWRLVQHPAILKFMRPFDDTQSIKLSRAGATSILGELNEFAYLCAHAALSDWRRLKWLSDLNAMLANRDDAEIISMVEHAARLDADRCALQVLALRELLWARPMPSELRAKINHGELSKLFDYAFERLTSPYRPVSDIDRIGRFIASARAQRRLYRTGASVAAKFSAKLFALSDILALPLPRWLDWLYVPLRPFFWVKRQIFPDRLRQLSMRSYRQATRDQSLGESRE